ncbi:MAG: arsenate reductase (azurin) small subunit [Rhodospirillaceae bacterium]
MRDVRRRDFLKGGVAVAAGVGVAAKVMPTAAETKKAEAAPAYPSVDIAPLVSIPPGTEIPFDYPDGNSPAVLLRLKQPADGGVGPDRDIVAFSLLCTHKGCPLNFLADRQMLVCPCHWSSFDPAKGGRLIIGQASQSLPQMTLEVKEGMVRAVGIEGLIYGRHTNIL